MFVGAVLLLGLAWVAITGLLARSQLRDVRGGIAQAQQAVARGDLASARAITARVARHAHRAHLLTTGPAWATIAQLPAGGSALRSIRGIASAADGLTHGPLPALLDERARLAPGRLRRADGSLDLAAIERAAPALVQADAVATHQLDAVRDLPAHTWLGAVDQARTDVLGELRSVHATVRSADLAARIMPPLLGARGTRRYFVAFQNEAESRGTGGLPGTFGILSATDGRLHFDTFASDSTLDGVRAGVNLGPDFAQLYQAGDPTGLFVNSNLGPNFPYAARIWTAMWQRHAGQRLDGAFALDPTALSYLLGVTGPATLPGGQTVDAGNVVALTESTAYRDFGTHTAARKAFLRAVAKAVSTRVVDGAHGNAGSLLDAAGRAVGERRLLAWSSDPELERLIARTATSGQIPRSSSPYAGLSIVNDGGDKLDYYLGRSLRWQASGCGTSRAVTATIALTNGAPSGLPASATQRTDDPPYRTSPGDNRLEVSWFATQDARLDTTTIDGTPAAARLGFELGHPVYTVDVEIPRGATRTLVLHLVERGGAGVPTVLRQPGVQPLQVALEPAACH